MAVFRADEDDVDLDVLDDSDVDAHTVEATPGEVVLVDGEPLPARLQDVDLSVDSDLERVRDAVVDRERLERGRREYSFSIDFDLDPTDPDDRRFLAFLSRLGADD